MTTVNTYLTFDGNCETAFEFYRKVFGGEFEYMGRFSEMPPQEGQPPLTEEEKNRIMHVSLPISKETRLMGSDTTGQWATYFNQGNNFSISIQTETTDKADRLFEALSQGGTATMPMNKTFWGSYFGMLTDQFGISWMINVDVRNE